MSVIQGKSIEAAHIYRNDGAPVGGTDEVQTITVTGNNTAGGEYKLKFEGFVTPAIADDAAAATVQTALRALPSIGSDGVGVSGSAGGPYTVTFAGNRGKQAVGLIEVHESDDDVTVEVEETTPGVSATARGAEKGALLVDFTNAKLYINTGTALAPTWTVVGSQS